MPVFVCLFTFGIRLQKDVSSTFGLIQEQVSASYQAVQG